MNALLESLSHLGPHERLQLVEDLWDSIDEACVPVMNDEVYNELMRRSQWVQANASTAKTLEDIAVDLGVRL